MKRLLTLTLALVMSLSLTACGGSDDAGSSDESDVSVSASQSAEDGSGDASVPEGRISDEKLASSPRPITTWPCPIMRSPTW